MSGLDPEDLGRLRAIEVAVTREEAIPLADVAWLTESLYGLQTQVDELDANTSSLTSELSEMEARVERAEGRLDEELTKVERLTEECAKLADECDALRAQALAAELSPARLKFLRSALQACLESVDRSVPKRKSKRNVDLR